MSSLNKDHPPSTHTLFLNATIIDGSGNTPRCIGSLLIQNSKIHTIRPVPSAYTDDELIQARATGVRIINCENGHWTLSPAFIDMHAHSDLALLHTPTHEAKITQGVMTEVIGQDGISYAPVDDGAMRRIREQIAGWNGDPDEQDYPGFWGRWRTVGEYLGVLDGEGVATNVAYLVPQGNLRGLVKGWDGGLASGEEVGVMKGGLRWCLQEGAVGMSSGLTYVPGCFATDGEIAELCKVVEEFGGGGNYCPHTKSYGKGALRAYGEMIQIARETGVRLHLTHATMNYGENAGRAGESIEMVDEAIEEGVDVTLDTYPYLPGSTTLASTLPSWAASADDKLALLNDPESLAKIKHQALHTGTDGCHGMTLQWDILEISGVSKPELASKYVGKTLAQIAKEQYQDPFETYIQILKADTFNSTILSHSCHEGNVRNIMRHPRHTGGSDGILTSTKPHSRGWGTFPRYLGHYARDLPNGKSRNIYHATSNSSFDDVALEVVFKGGLEEAVAHVTSRAAAVIGARGRGMVREGYWADLVLFDAGEVRDVATYKEPKQAARGIRGGGWVNGVGVVEEGLVTGRRAGRTVRTRNEGDGGWEVS